MNDLQRRYAHLRPENRPQYGGPIDDLGPLDGFGPSPNPGPPLQISSRYAKGKPRQGARV